METHVASVVEGASGAGSAATASLLLPVVVATGNFMTGLDQNVVITALPAIDLSLGEAPAVLSLTITAYVAALIMALPIGGWASDRFGARRAYAFAVLTFTCASILCGLSESFWTLVAARALQGFGGAMMGTVGQVVILTSFPRSRTLKINTFISMVIQVAPMVGPLLGGALTTYLSWRWIFYLNVPIGLVAAAMAGRLFPTSRRAEREPFDLAGFVLVGSGTSLLVFGMNGIADTAQPGWFIAAQLALAILVLGVGARHCLRAGHPLIDLSLLRIRTFRTAMLTGGWFDTIALTSIMFLLPLMLQVGFGMNAVQAGSLTFLAAVGSFASRPAIPFLLKRFGFRSVLLFNTPVLAALMAGFAFFQASTPTWLMAGWIIAFGLLRSVQWGSTGNLAYSDVPPDKLARFSALYFVTWQMAVAISVGGAAALIAVLRGGGEASTFEFHAAFLVEGLLTLGALIAYSRLKPDDGRHVSGHQVMINE